MLFEKASRCKLRFDSVKGQLSVEDLWTLKLTDLDAIAVSLHTQLKDTGVSFVTPNTKVNDLLQLKFDVVKHIIDTRLTEAEIAKQASDKKKQMDAIMELIAQKQNEQLSSASIEELTNKLKELQGQ